MHSSVLNRNVKPAQEVVYSTCLKEIGTFDLCTYIHIYVNRIHLICILCISVGQCSVVGLYSLTIKGT